jgi:hypothetical protein
MLRIAAFVLCLVYFACVLAGVPLAGPRIAPWFLSALSALFVWCYLVFVRGRASVALAVVIVVTLVFPLGALIVIGWPVYRSWSALAASFWAAAEERGPFGGVEFLAPTIAAALCAGIVGRLRPNIAVTPTPSARRLP